MELFKSKYSDRKKSGRRQRRDDDPRRSFRNSRNDRYSRDDRGSRYSRDDRRDSATVTCADCGDQCEVPFVPKTSKPVYCDDCFRQNKSHDRDDRYSRDDRRESNQDNSRKPKNVSLSKKQESFFSNGSEKFYATIKEKLFEILGGKECSSCGFKDERALGISSIYDDSSFDTTGRGGSASSWGKYISSPDLAREDLRILCLNCNQIRQPVSKPKNKSKPKKSKYFPR